MTDLPPDPDPDPGTARRLHPLTPVLDLVVSARQLALPVLVLLLGGPGGTPTVVILIVLAAVVVGVRVLRWHRFGYRVDGADLVIDEGVLQRSRRVIPLARIQQVDVQRALRHQVFGVAALRVDTAGGGRGAEAVLEVLGVEEAHRLRNELLARRSRVVADAAVPAPAPHAGSAPPRPAPPADPVQVVLRVPARRLAVGGVTGARLAIVITLAASALRLLDELPDGTARELLERVPDTGSATTLLLVLALPLWFGLAAVAAVVSDAGFTLSRDGDALQVRRGLLDKREASTARHRIQVVRIEQNLVRRALRLASVQLQSAGGTTSSTGDVSRITVPVVPVSDLPHLLEHVLPGAPGLPELHPAPPAARRRAILRRAAPAVLLASATSLAAWPAGAAALVAVPLGVVVGELAWRGLGHATVPDHVVARRGGLLRETVVIPVAKAQSVRLRTSPLQRRGGLATLLVDVAGRGRTPAVVDGSLELLRPVRRFVLGAPAARRDEAVARRSARTA